MADKEIMWFATETVFIDGKLFGSRCIFIKDDTSPVGHCYCSHDEEPRNSCKIEFDNRIEIHTDWFESEELAEQFVEGKVTYIHHYDAYYKAAIKSTLTRFRRREIAPVDEENGLYAHRGVYKKHMLTEKPYWVR
jgi:hypothetical protein